MSARRGASAGRGFETEYVGSNARATFAVDRLEQGGLEVVAVQLIWESVGAALLELERRPVVVLDVEGRIVRTNRALQYLLEEGTPTQQVKVVDEWVHAHSRRGFLLAWEKALAGERPRVAVAIHPTPFHFEPVFEFRALMGGAGPRAIVMVMVDATTGGPALPLAPPAGALYEVVVDGKGRPVRLLREFSTDHFREGGLSVTCFGQRHGRVRACEKCPLRGLTRGRVTSVIQLESHTPFRAQLLSARWVRDEVASVSVVPLGEPDYANLVRHRVEALAANARLSDREQRVLQLLLTGANHGGIAVTLQSSASTVKRTQRSLLRKLGADGREDLLRLLFLE